MSEHRGVTYMVCTMEDLTPCEKIPPGYLEFGPGRRTIRWRGKKFQVRQPRLITIHFGYPPPPARQDLTTCRSKRYTFGHYQELPPPQPSKAGNEAR